VAVNCSVAPTAIEAELGPTVIDCSTAAGAAVAVTVRGAGLLVIPDKVAVMLVLPAATPVARPPVIVASARTEEFQVTREVRSRVVPLR
jgi:ABC-type transport system involved in cytochrome c biogenesis permease component